MFIAQSWNKIELNHSTQKIAHNIKQMGQNAYARFKKKGSDSFWEIDIWSWKDLIFEIPKNFKVEYLENKQVCFSQTHTPYGGHVTEWMCKIKKKVITQFLR